MKRCENSVLRRKGNDTDRVAKFENDLRSSTVSMVRRESTDACCGRPPRSRFLHVSHHHFVLLPSGQLCLCPSVLRDKLFYSVFVCMRCFTVERCLNQGRFRICFALCVCARAFDHLEVPRLEQPFACVLQMLPLLTAASRSPNLTLFCSLSGVLALHTREKEIKSYQDVSENQ